MFKYQDLKMFRLKLNTIWTIFTHLKLWVAVARHNFKYVKICFKGLFLRGEMSPRPLTPSKDETHWFDVVLLRDQLLQHWPYIKTTLGLFFTNDLS